MPFHKGFKTRFDGQFRERYAGLQVRYAPAECPEFGEIAVSIPGAIIYMTAEQAEIAAGFLIGASAIAKRHREHRLLCPPDCPECGRAMRAGWYNWVCDGCDIRFDMGWRGSR